MERIDHIDRQLIGLLRTNARLPVSAIAKQLKVSRATVQNRINKLEKQDIITGYTALISPTTDEQLAMVRAHMCIELTKSSTKKIKQALLAEPGICAIHTTNGRWDMIVELQATSLPEFDVMLSRIRSIAEISNSETSILLTSYQVTA